jgi:hypothetical protein
LLAVIVLVVLAPVLNPPLLSNHPAPLFKSIPKAGVPEGLYKAIHVLVS